jgi:hypothetical protein
MAWAAAVSLMLMLFAQCFTAVGHLDLAKLPHGPMSS